MNNIAENDLLVLANIIDDCNLNCRYCYNRKPYAKTQLDLKKLTNLILYLTKLNKHIILNIEGGEPTLHKELYDFCISIQNINNIECYIYTNLTQTAEYYEKILKIQPVNLVATCHNNSKQFIDTVLNIKRVFYEKIELNIMFEDFDVYDSIRIYEKLRMLNNQTNLVYIFNTYNYKAAYTEDDKKQFFDAIRTSNVNITDINNKQLKINESNLGFYTNQFNFKYMLCEAGKKSLYIHNNGKIYYCPSFYEENKKPFSSINSFHNISLNKEILCICNHCPDYIDINKNKVFK